MTDITLTIDADLVRNLIRKQFPEWAHLPVEPVANGGYDNYTFHVGDTMSARLPRDEGHAPQVEKEAKWLPFLQPHLSLPIPAPLALGMPDEHYPFHWSINRWIEGETLRHDNITDMNEFAVELAEFLKELQGIDATSGPAGGEHNYYRGCPLSAYMFNEWTLEALHRLGEAVDAKRCLQIWHRALSTEWTGKPLWIHGDVNPGNLLVKDGRLASVIDFGIMAVGDPAADLTMAWTFFDDVSRPIFLEASELDTDTIDRARGWALWKALVTWMWDAPESASVSAAKKTIDTLVNE